MRAELGKEYIDELSGLYNRRYLNRTAKQKIREACKEKTHLSIVLIDLDFFKNVNDTYGHARGDSVLREFAGYLKSLFRQKDSVFRYGGDEFISILPNTDRDLAIRISQRFIDQCRSREFAQIRLTLSIGVSSLPEDGSDFNSLFDMADKNLYSAKRHGRDRVGFFKQDKKRISVPTTEIIGRHSELERIRQYIEPINNESGGAVLIGGEIGVGKTRLAQEIVRDLDYRECRLMQSNLSATTRSIPYYPFREIIRTQMNISGRKCLENFPQPYIIELMKIVPELSDKPIEDDEHIYMIDKFRLFEGVRKFLELQLSGKLMFICLDNIHWADEGSLELLYYLIRALKESPVIFFLIHRVEEVRNSIFQDTMNSMARENLFLNIFLELLDIPDVSRMISQIIDTGPTSELIDYIFVKTGGNPFFVEELMKSLELDNRLFWNGTDWKLNLNEEPVIPFSIESVINQKLQMIDKETRDLLEQAAVIGREFDFSFLQNISGINEGQMFDLIDNIVDLRLLKELNAERYCFTEDIIREIVYQQMNSVKAIRYHKNTAEELLRQNSHNVKNVVEELSYHFALSGDMEKAAEYNIMAGDKSTEAYANRDAIRFYNSAIECLKGSLIEEKEKREIECLKQKAHVQNIIGENELAISNLEEVVERARRLGDTWMEIDGLNELCNPLLDVSRFEQVLETAEEVEKRSKKAGYRKGETLGIGNQGKALWHLGEFHKAIALYKRSMKINEEIGRSDSNGVIFNNIGIIYWNTGEFKKALDYFQRSQKITSKSGDIKTEAASLNNTGLIYWSFCNYAKAVEYFRSSLRIAKKISDRVTEGVNLNNIGAFYRYIGEYNEALEHYECALKISMEVGDCKTESAILDNIGSIYMVLGKFEKAHTMLKKSLEIRREIGNRKGEMESLVTIGDLFIEMNNFKAAEKNYIKSYKIALETDSKPFINETLCCLADVHLEQGNYQAVQKEIKQILSSGGETTTKDLKARTYTLEGRLFSELDEWDKAKISFKQSELMLKNLKNKYYLAKVYYYQSLMYRKSGENGRAEKNIKKAMNIFRELHAENWIKRIEKMTELKKKR